MPAPSGVDHRALMGLVRRLVVAEADVAVRAEHLRRPELRRPARRAARERRLHVRVVVGLVPRPVGLGVVGLQALVEDQALVREALEAHGVPSVVGGLRSQQRVPAHLAQRGVAGVQRAGPAVGCPAGRLVERRRRRGRPRAARPAGGRHRRSPARSATAASSRLPCPRRPHRGSTSRVESSVVGPAGIRRSPAASSAGPNAANPTTRVPLERHEHAVPGRGRRGDRGVPAGSRPRRRPSRRAPPAAAPTGTPSAR